MALPRTPLDEVNEFIWPGVNLRPISRLFGVLPAEVFDEIRTKLRAILHQRRTVQTE